MSDTSQPPGPALDPEALSNLFTLAKLLSGAGTVTDDEMRRADKWLASRGQSRP